MKYKDTDLVFGHITGIQEGEIFESREKLSLSGIHRSKLEEKNNNE